MKGNMVIIIQVIQKSSTNMSMNTQGKADIHINISTGQHWFLNPKPMLLQSLFRTGVSCL